MLTTIVGIGLAGRLGDDPESPDTRGPEASGAAATSPGPVAVAPSAEPAAIVLTAPSGQLTTVALHVRGTAEPIVEQVELVLMHADEALAAQTVRPTSRGTFGGTFTVAAPRRAQALTVVAIGRDGAGAEVVTVRRPVAVAPLADARAGVAAITPRVGEDGVVGSRGVDPAAVQGAEASADRAAEAGGARGPSQAAGRAPWPPGRVGWRAYPAER